MFKKKSARSPKKYQAIADKNELFKEFETLFDSSLPREVS